MTSEAYLERARALQPQRYSGYEFDPSTFYTAVMDIDTAFGLRPQDLAF
jgi:hypothetical protein